jgi:hypothetical protein
VPITAGTPVCHAAARVPPRQDDYLELFGSCRVAGAEKRPNMRGKLCEIGRPMALP